MAKSPIKESHTLAMTGLLNAEDMTMDFGELGIKNLKDYLEEFEGKNITLTVKLSEEVE